MNLVIYHQGFMKFLGSMTQKELADKIGVREQQIQRYEASLYSFASFDRLKAIAHALNIEITQAVMQVRV
jgi:HTH-type transcriptional regulator / antitoxin HipB